MPIRPYMPASSPSPMRTPSADSPHETDDLLQRLCQLEHEVDRLESELASIRQGRVWKLAMAYFALRDRLKRQGRAILRALQDGWHRLLPSRPTPVAPGWSRFAPGVAGRVSVIFPFPKGAPGLEATIAQVLTQSYQDVELIVVLTGADEAQHAPLLEYRDDPRAILLQQEGGNLVQALNAGALLASGDLQTWVSHDVSWPSDYLEKAVRALQERPQAGWVATTDTVSPGILYFRSLAWILGPFQFDDMAEAISDFTHRLRCLTEAKGGQTALPARFAAVEARDEERQAILRTPLPLQQVRPGIPLPEPEHALLLLNGNEESDLLTEQTADHFVVYCVQASPIEHLRRERFREADVIVAPSLTAFDRLAAEFPGRVWLLEEQGDQGLEQLKHFANLRAFEKRPESPRLGCPTGVVVRSKLRVAIQVDAMDRGGLEEVVFHLMTSLDRQRIEPRLIVNHRLLGYLGQKLRAHGIPVHLTERRTEILEALLAAEPLDVVNFHHSTFGLDAYRRHGVATLYSLHTSYTWLSPEETATYRHAMRQIDRFLAVSEQVKQFSVPKFELPWSRVSVVPNGLPDFAFQPEPLTRASFALRDEDTIFLHVGSFSPIKNQLLMVSAVAALRETYPMIKLVLVGNVLDKAYEELLRNQIQVLGLQDMVVMMDYMAKPKLAALYGLADAFLLPSLQEGWSIAAMEAMHFGLPLILTDVGSARELIDNEDVGTIIPTPYSDLLDTSLPELLRWASMAAPPNLDALVQAMARVVQEPELWRERGRRAAEKQRARFSAAGMADTYEHAFRFARAVDSKQPWPPHR